MTDVSTAPFEANSSALGLVAINPMVIRGCTALQFPYAIDDSKIKNRFALKAEPAVNFVPDQQS